MTTPSSGSSKFPISSQAGCILVVDDEDDVRNDLLRSLTDTEFRCVGVADAVQALELLRKSHPRTILLDWALPGGISGMGLLKALKADHATRHIPVIMISGLKRSNAEKLEVQRVGAEGFFPKFDLMAQRGNLLELLRGAVAKNTSPAQWRLLVIEDDIGVQSLIRFALEGLEFEIHFSIAGRDSSRLALDLKPNLILLDMGLPDINGIEVCKTLRENNETKGIPILAMSGIDRTAGVLESSIKALGIEDFLPKPFEDSELLLRISQLLGRVHLERSIGDLLVRGKVRIDVDRRCVWVGERQVESISPKLFDLLQVLMKNTDGVSRQKLRSLLWSDAKNSNVADVTVCRLRKLLGFGEKEGILATPDGYKLVG